MRGGNFRRPLRIKTEASFSHSMDTVHVYHLLAALLVLAGLAGLILPGLPGSPLIFAGLLSQPGLKILLTSAPAH
jgi:hypothetical protein